MTNQAAVEVIVLKKEGALRAGSALPISLQPAQMRTGAQFWTGEEINKNSLRGIRPDHHPPPGPHPQG